MHAYQAWPFLSAPGHPILSAIWSVFAHGSLSVLVVGPIILRSDKRVLYAVLAAALGVGIDIDHAVAAQSLSPRAMETLAQRPETHSLLFSALLAAIAFAVTRRMLIAWSVFAVLVAHLLFDAAGGGTPWLFPLKQPTSIPWLVCPLGIMALLGISTLLAGVGLPRRPGAQSPRAQPSD